MSASSPARIPFRAHTLSLVVISREPWPQRQVTSRKNSLARSRVIGLKPGASEITGLRPDAFNGQTRTVEITQRKTGSDLVLSLMPTTSRSRRLQREARGFLYRQRNADLLLFQAELFALSGGRRLDFGDLEESFTQPSATLELR